MGHDPPPPERIVTEFRSRRDPPKLLCCRPRWGPWPSGWKWAHADRCVARVDGRARHGQRVDLPMDEVLLDLGTTGSATEDWRTHPAGHRCRNCEYVEAHLDDDDDNGLPLPAVLENGDDDDRREG